MKEERLQLLFKKYIKERLTAQESEELEAYINDVNLESTLRKSIGEASAKFNEGELANEPYIDAIVKDLESKVKQRIRDFQKRKPITALLYWRYAAAVSIILCAAGLFFYSLSDKTDPVYKDLHAVNNKDFPPGTNKATLMLSSGKSIELSQEREGINVSGDEIRYENGALLLDHTAQQMLTLAVPMAGKYKLVLSDGTKVWLNAASSIAYPSTFQGKQRVVEVQGEAYFEVHHDSEHPFLVKTASQTIKVLGTAFNINTYNKDKATTTLAEGRIALTTKNGAVQVLSPGQQAIVMAGAFTVNKVNTQDYIAWTEDLLVLSDQNIQDIFGQLERWYDVEFINKEVINRDKKLSGEIPRNTSLLAILQAIEEQIHVKFEINERRIMIKI